MAKKAIKAWGGFSDGELWFDRSNEGAAVFRTRKIARSQYCDVRRIEIREVLQRKARKPYGE